MRRRFGKSLIACVPLCTALFCVSLGSARGAEPLLILDRVDIVADASRGTNRELVCRRAERPPVVDGRLDDPCWKLCQPQSDFLDFGIADFPVENPDRLAGQQTIVRAAWTADGLYLGFECVAPSGAIEAEDAPADAVFTGKEAIEVFLDPGRSNQSYYLFAANPRGTPADAKGTVGKPQYGWNGVWTVEAEKGEKRWTVEMAVPFSTLGRTAEVGAEWGVNFLRHHTAYHVVSIWSNPREPVPDDPPRFGRVVFAGPDGARPRAAEKPLLPPESPKRLAVEVLPLLVGKLASDLYFTGERGYTATIESNPGDPNVKSREVFLGVRRAEGKEYLKLGRLGKLDTGSARLRLALGDLGAGDYSLDTGVVREDGTTETMSSFPFRLEKTPYDL
jgi:hypothetical protein